MEAEKVSFIQEALMGILKCLGLEKVAEPTTNYQISEVHYSPNGKTMETNGGTTADVVPNNDEDGVAKLNITSRRITSGGGGKTNSTRT